MGLYISSATASSELNESAINQAISQLAIAVALARQQGSIPSGPSLDVTFMLPGQFEKPDFNGMRMGGYSDESDTLFFERAVPEHMVHSEQAGEYVAAVMQDVVTNANDFFHENSIPFDNRKWQQLMQLLARTHASLSQ